MHVVLSSFLSRRSFRQILYALVLCAICPALAVMVYNGTANFARSQERTRAQTLDLVRYVAHQQQFLTGNTQVLLNTLSKLPEVRQANVPAMNALFKELRDTHGIYANIIRMDAEGTLLSASQPFTPPVSVKDRKYFQDAMRTGRFSAGEFVVGRLINEPVFQFAVPVSGESGTINGVLGATIRLGSFDAFFSNISLPPSWRFAMLDHTGARLLRLPPDERFPLGTRASPGVLKELESLPGDEGTFTTTGPDGITVFYSFVRLRLTPADPPYMTLVVGFPARSASEAFVSDVMPDLLLMLAVLALALYIARRLGAAAIGGGLDRLALAARSLSAGDLSHRIGEFPASMEIRELGMTFDSMAASLRSESAERKQAEGELEMARSYIANILNSMPSVVIGLDAGGAVTHWNRIAEDTAGLDASKALGLPLEEAFPRLSPHAAAIRLALAERRPLKLERDPFKQGGEQAFQDIMFSPLAEGAAGGVVRVDDVTRRVRLEEMMVQSEKMMSLGGLAAGMAHEINNPLGAILQSAQVMQTRLVDSPGNRAAATQCGVSMEGVLAYAGQRGLLSFLDGIREAGRRAARIVANMLDFSRKSQEQRLPADLNALLERAVELALSDFDLKKKYDFRAISIIRDHAQDLPEIPCSRTEIEQVVLNLLKNAAQAMGGERAPGGAKPVITLRTALDGQFARIEVEDNGPGMDESVRKRIFEPFFTTKPVGEGTGLGLSVSYFIIVTNHGGRFEVESAPGKGTRFILRLPLAGGGLDPVPPPAR